MTITETEGYIEIKAVTLRYLDAVKITKIPGIYEHVKGGRENFYASYYAAQIMDLFGELDKLPDEDVDTWAAYIQEKQGEDGAYLSIHQPYKASQLLPELDSVWHSTRGLLWSLRTLNRPALRPLTFMEPLLDVDTLYRWTKGFDWSVPWTVGNQILGCVTALLAMRDWFGVSEVDDLLEKGMYPALEELHDRETGLWGTQLGAPLWNGLFGTIHIMPIYFAQGWPLRHLERCADSTLECQLADGSFWQGGSNCPDFDGAYMLANLAELTDYRREDLEAAARKYLAHALMHQDSLGLGWRSKRCDWDSQEVRDLLQIRTLLDAWFYPLSIALIAHMLGDTGYEGPYKLNRMSLHECNVWD